MSFRMLPVSPMKMNILQQNNGIVNNANQNLLKVSSQTISAKADSTLSGDTLENLVQGTMTPLPIDPRTGVPFKKHHHSVKKFQTPSVSRRNARERNRVKQVNDGFFTLRTHIPHLKNKTSKVDTLRAAVDYIRALRSLLGQPIKEESLHRGPVLITDLEDMQNSKGHKRSRKDSFDMGSSRCDSAMSNPDLSSMVYTLPPMMMMEDLDMRSSSPSSSVSSNSNNQNQEVDSTNGVYYEDMKENLTQNFHLIEGLDLGDQAQQTNWNWTTVSHEEQ